jgi:hypothetical protein
MERIDDTDDEVDFRPRRPPLDFRYDERGVCGAGLADSRRTLPDPFVDMRGRGGTWVEAGMLLCECTECRCAELNRFLESGLLLSGSLGLFFPVLLALEFGLLALLLVSLIQFLRFMS